MYKLIDSRWGPLCLALFAGLAATGLGLSLGQTASEQAALATRWTARAAFPFFLIAYSASSVSKLWPNAWSRSLLRCRRQWGLGFALAHSIHLVALAINLLVFDIYRPAIVLAGGGLAYALMFLMAATSNSWSVRVLGRKWKWLHIIGIHYIWILFLRSYASSLSVAEPDKFITAMVFVPLLLAALGLRLYIYFGGKRRVMAA